MSNAVINPMDLTGKVFVITGAASGIGRETAKLLHKLGAKLLLLDIDKNGLSATNELMDNKGILCDLDLTDYERLGRILKLGRAEISGSADFEGYNGMVHCAGIPSLSPLRALSNEHYLKVQSINAQAGLNLAKILSSRGMFHSAGSSFVFISSVYGVVGSSCNVAYTMSKAAVIGMTKSLALELAPKRIRVNCVAPGFIKTTMADGVEAFFDKSYAEKIEALHPLGWGEAVDIANMIAFLLSDASKWTTGAVFNIDGGFTAQ